jgi:hypothetical protein
MKGSVAVLTREVNGLGPARRREVVQQEDMQGEKVAIASRKLDWGVSVCVGLIWLHIWSANKPATLIKRLFQQASVA